MSEYTNINDVNNMLDVETQITGNECWNKLSKTTKNEKLVEFTENYCLKHKYDNSIKLILESYLNQSLDRKKLQKKTDLEYNIEKQEIEEIHNLVFHKLNKKFTIKKQEKKTKQKTKTKTKSELIC